MNSPISTGTLRLLECLIDENADSSTVELGEGDCQFLLDQYNVKLCVSSKGGFICYFGMKTGLAGRGTTRGFALMLMLANLQFKRNKDIPLENDLKIFFDFLTSK